MDIGIGIAGFGFMGRTHYRAYLRHAGVRVTHICSRRDPRKEAPRGGGDVPVGPDVTWTSSFDDLCGAAVDAVDICLPTFLHAGCALKALAAGKHVFLEKPLALTVEEAEEVAETAARGGRILQVGHCIRFWPAYEELKRTVEEETYGKVRAAFFRRFSARPGWSSGSWILDPEKSGGAALDLHIHDADAVAWLFGRPVSVASRGVRGAEGGIDYIATHYGYDGGPLVTAEGGWLGAGDLPFRMAFTVMCDNAVIVFEEGVFSVYPARGGKETPALPREDGWTREIEAFVASVRRGTPSDRVTPADARDAVEIVLAEMKSVDSGGAEVFL